MGGQQSQAEKRGPGRPREERVTRAVLETVLSLVTEQGMDAVTMDAVAARAGVSKPAIYRRWPTKQDLILAAAESRVGPVSVADLGDFRAELRALLTARLEVYRLPGTDRLLAELMSAAAKAGTARSAYATYSARVTAQTRVILERGIERGDVRADVDVTAASTLVAAPLVFRLLGEQEPLDGRFVDEVVDLVARAVAARP
ncbi:TetR/AcrR family transcriptional regulator [Streptomyces sp. NPDC007251]|uniref:TetR/AcrR family transcriptional regulator n=1 Tax=Streptomyces sp. NPDC007251 TaxID=3154483 RepID=UPI0033D6D211